MTKPRRFTVEVEIEIRHAHAEDAEAVHTLRQQITRTEARAGPA